VAAWRAGRKAHRCPEHSHVGPGRLHALIDGVFAIAVTLLVLDLPTLPGSADFVHRLVENRPSYAAYLVSSTTIALIWIEHHGMMSAVRFVNRRFLERTLLFLLFVSIIPWPTALAAEHIRQSGAPARAVALLFAATMMLMGLSMALSWRYLSEHEQLVEPARTATPDGARRAVLGALAYIPAIIFALLVPPISFRDRRGHRHLFRPLQERGAGPHPQSRARRRLGMSASSQLPPQLTPAPWADRATRSAPVGRRASSRNRVPPRSDAIDLLLAKLATRWSTTVGAGDDIGPRPCFSARGAAGPGWC